MVLNGMVNSIDKINYIVIECHLDEDWDEIKDLLLNKFNFTCQNILSNEIINNNSKRAYQCFCSKTK